MVCFPSGKCFKRQALQEGFALLMIQMLLPDCRSFYYGNTRIWADQPNRFRHNPAGVLPFLEEARFSPNHFACRIVSYI
jgi:hypothetical protein